MILMLGLGFTLVSTLVLLIVPAQLLRDLRGKIIVFWFVLGLMLIVISLTVTQMQSGDVHKILMRNFF